MRKQLMKSGRAFVLIAMVMNAEWAKAEGDSESFNQFGSRFGGPSGLPPQGPQDVGTFQAAFEVRTNSNEYPRGKQVKQDCAVCHKLSVLINGREYGDGAEVTLRKGETHTVKVKDTPVPRDTPPGGDSSPPHTSNQKFTVWPQAVDGQTITSIQGNGPADSPQVFIAKKAEILQYLLDNSEGLMAQDKDWPEDPADEPMNKTVRLLPMEVAVDANRDGVIQFSGNSTGSGAFDKTEESKPYRFWCNDDDDYVGTAENDRVPVVQPDFQDDQIAGRRDLEDFTRLYVRVGAFYQELANGKMKVGLKWSGNATGTPKVKVYKSADAAGSDSYLKNDVAATAQVSGEFRNALGEVSGSTPLVLPADVFAGYSESNPKRCLLFEASGEGKGQLCITIHKADGTLIGEGPGVWLDIKNIKKMYQSSEGDVFAGAPPDEAKQTLVSVHGWNMSPEGSRNYAETMFKRLWHRGFKGRFAYFRWNTYWITATDVIGTLTTQYFANYNNSEYIAWTQGAPALKAFVASLPYQSKNIAAHSMGNIVVGEAMRLGMQVNNYALMQPAVPAACYDEREVLKQTDTYDRSFLGVGVTMWDEASPDEDPDTATRNMSYRGMLKDIGQNGNLILFYLPNDAATSNAWELNNDLTKPSGTLSGHFRYERNAPAGQKLYRDFGGGVREYSWSSRRESASYACRTWGKAAGADGRTEGSVRSANRVNLGNSGFQLPGEQFSGFGDEHSGQFTAQIQQLKPFYDELMRRLDIGDPNP